VNVVISRTVPVPELAGYEAVEEVSIPSISNVPAASLSTRTIRLFSFDHPLVTSMMSPLVRP